MPCAVGRAELKKILAGCVDRSGLDNAYVEMIQTRGMSPNFERDPRKSEPRFIAFAVPFGWILRPEEFEKGLDVLVSNRRRISPDSIDSRIKNYHWLDLVSGMYEAYDYGHDTVILTDQENNISEGPGFNIFCVDEAGLNSPKKGVLKGITRQTVLDLAKELNLPFQLSSISLEKLKSANEVFATSTAGGIMPITKINGQLIGQGAPGEITRKLHKAYWDKHSDPYWSVSKEDLLK
jgi:branched-chain amino acid aminotransferase